MSHKKKHGAPVPPGNVSNNGPQKASGPGEQVKADANAGAPFEDQDPKRRLGNFEGAGEHALQQPGGKNDANH